MQDAAMNDPALTAGKRRIAAVNECRTSNLRGNLVIVSKLVSVDRINEEKEERK